MKSIVRLIAVAFAALILCSCATLLPPQPREFKLSEAQLQDLVGRHFATAQKYLGVLDIRMTAPRVSLQPESNRVLTMLDVALDAPLIGRPLKGAVSISGRLRFDQAANAILLEEPRADSFKVDGVPAIYADKVNLVGGWLSEQVLKGFTVYKLKPEDLRFENVNYSPAEFKVKPGELVIGLVPKATQ
jgi:hypothetical protein